MVMLQRCSVRRENGHVMEVVSSREGEFGVLCCLTTPGLRRAIRRQAREGEWSYRGGRFNGERVVMLRRLPV